MATCPSYTQSAGSIEFENGKSRFAAPDRANKEEHPPGFDGTLIMPMGRTKQTFTIVGRFVSAGAGDSSVATRMSLLESLKNNKLGTLTIPIGPSGSLSYTGVRVQDVQWGEVEGDAATSNVSIPYEVTLEKVIWTAGSS